MRSTCRTTVITRLLRLHVSACRSARSTRLPAPGPSRSASSSINQRKFSVKETHMIKGKSFYGLVAIAAASLGSPAFAQDKDQGCIVLKSVAEVEQAVVN